MAITFSGLSSGLDTGSIITELMKIERAPIDRLKKDQAYYNNRLKAFSDLEAKMKAFEQKAEEIDTASELNASTVRSSSEDYVSVSADGRSQAGSYQLSVVALAQQQKDVSQGYADKSAQTLGTGSISLTVDGTAHSINIDAENNSLEGIAVAINDAELGVGATVINDGTGTPYRLVLTGNSVSDSFSLDASGLSGGTEAGPVLSNTQPAQQAHIRLDGIDVYSDSNKVDSAVPGLSIELMKADENSTTTINISADSDSTKEKIKGFTDAYNDIITFMATQKDASWSNDPAFRSVKRQMQNLLTTRIGDGNYSSLAQLGFETQKDGQIVLNDTKLSSALEDDFSGVVTLFTGNGDVDGISNMFTSFLEEMTDSVDGLHATRKKSTDRNIRRIDQRIELMESRMEQKEKSLRERFTAMEELVNGLNAQGNYMLQQLSSIQLGGQR